MVGNVPDTMHGTTVTNAQFTRVVRMAQTGMAQPGNAKTKFENYIANKNQLIKQAPLTNPSCTIHI